MVRRPQIEKEPALFVFFFFKGAGYFWIVQAHLSVLHRIIAQLWWEVDQYLLKGFRKVHRKEGKMGPARAILAGGALYMEGRWGGDRPEIVAHDPRIPSFEVPLRKFCAASVCNE